MSSPTELQSLEFVKKTEPNPAHIVILTGRRANVEYGNRLLKKMPGLAGIRKGAGRHRCPVGQLPAGGGRGLALIDRQTTRKQALALYRLFSRLRLSVPTPPHVNVRQPSFTQFSGFPPEIRSMIWEFSFESSDVLAVGHHHLHFTVYRAPIRSSARRSGLTEYLYEAYMRAWDA